MEDLLSALLSNENSVRILAEASYTKLKNKNAHNLIMGLTEAISNPQMDIRCLAIVLLRGFTVREKNLWDSMSQEEIAQIRSFFLEKLEVETSSHIHKKLVDCIAANAKLGEWPELFTLVGRLITSGTKENVLLSLELVEKLGEYIGPVLLQHLEELMGFISPTLTSSDVHVRLNAARALLSLLFEMQNPPDKVFESIAISIDVTRDILMNHGYNLEVEAQELLDLIHQLSESNPNIFYKSKEKLFDLLADVVRVKTDSEDLQVVAIETLSELVASKKTSYYREQATGLLNLSMDLMHTSCTVSSEDEHDNELNVIHITRPEKDEKYDDSFGAESDDLLGESALQAFVNMTEVMRPSEAVYLSLQVAQLLMGDMQKWRSRRTALIITSILCDECSEALRPFLPQLISPILGAFKDSNSKVRYGALFVVGCFADAFTREEDVCLSFQDQYHTYVLPAILEFIKNNASHPYLLHRGINTLRCFMDQNNCSKSNISPAYDEDIIKFALSVVQNDSCHMFVKEEAFAMMTNVFVMSRQEVLESFQSSLMPMYIDVINAINQFSGASQREDNYALSRVRGRCLESFAVYCKHVNFDSVREVASSLVLTAMNILCSSNSDRICDYSDPLTSYLNQSCVRLAGLMGDSFQPFLVNVIPALLFHIAEDLPMDIMFDDESGLPQSPSLSPTLGRAPSPGGSEVIFTKNLRGYGNVKLKCNTYLITEIETSCRVLYQYLHDLPNLMWVYTPDILQAISDISMLMFSDEMYITIGTIITDSVDVFLVHCVKFPTFPIIDTSSLSIMDLPQREIHASKLVGMMIDGGLKFFLNNLQMCVESMNGKEESMVFEKDLQKMFDIIDCTRELLLVLYSKWSMCLPGHDAVLSPYKEAPPPGMVVSDALFEDLVKMVLMISGIWIRHRFENNIDYTERDEFYDTENDMWTSLVDIIGWLAKICPEQMEKSNAFTGFVPFIKDMLNKSLLQISSEGLEVASNFSPLITMSMQCTLDIMECCPSLSATTYSEPFCEAILQLYGLDEESALMCVHAIGVCAMHAPPEFDSKIPRAAAILYTFLQWSPEAMFPLSDCSDEFMEQIQEIAVVSMFKLCVYRGNELYTAGGAGQIFSHVFESLPLGDNEALETRTFHRLFVSLALSQDLRLLGANKERSSEVFRVVHDLKQSIDPQEAEFLIHHRSSATNIDASATQAVAFWNEQLVCRKTYMAILHAEHNFTAVP